MPSSQPTKAQAPSADLPALADQQSRLEQLQAELHQTEQELARLQQAHLKALTEIQATQARLARHQETAQALEQLSQQHQTLAAHLHEIRTSTLIRATRPLVRAKLRIDRALGRAATAPCSAPTLATAPPSPQELDLARLRRHHLPCILAVSHSWGGGTQRHVQELAHHLQSRADFLLLSPLPDGWLRLRWLDGRGGQDPPQDFHWPSGRQHLVGMLSAAGVCHVHFHHLVGHAPEMMHLPQLLGVSYDFTAHDYYSACPQISLTTADKSYCGEHGLEQCHACVGGRPTPTCESIEDWRLRHQLFLRQARWVLAPSQDCAQRMRHYFPQARLRYAPHIDMQTRPATAVHAPEPLGPNRHLRVFLVGGLSEIKGGDVAEAVALEVARQKLPLEFHLLGYEFRPLKTQPQASLTVHGAYQEHELPQLLDRLQPHLMWFPAVWPETYSYTLSACLQAGLPVVASNLGAFPERLAQRPWTWVQPWDTALPDWLAFFMRVRQAFITGQAPALPEALPRLVTSATDWSYERDYLKGLSTR